MQQEHQKWERYKKDQENKIREENEADIDSKIQHFKDKLRREEDQENRRVEDDTNQKVKDFEKELNQKFD